MKILVIAAHPDDEILGMGGTIRKYTNTGNTVKNYNYGNGNFCSTFVKFEKFICILYD